MGLPEMTPQLLVNSSSNIVSRNVN